MEGQRASSQQEPAGNASAEEAGSTRTRIAQARVVRVKEKVEPGLNVSLILAIFINFAMIIVGSFAFGKCPVEPYIPLYLVAVGAVGFLAKCTTAARKMSNVQYAESTKIEAVLFSVEAMFFVLGSFWVYNAYPPSYDPNDGAKYCQRTAYLFAFIYISISYALLLAAIAGVLCFLFCICFVVATIKDEDAEANLRENEHATEQI
ncbi:unnamed protein product [Acanthoscelides obtectus]|uniref:Uncharacterized protein n=1 Tax=Acanthoscelides obtectus TaxID=200917 RepID=A0A9P0LAC8_ACAOB|nr:unnamed protein product [Acanthoscelides obtectus]CAK1652858.1 hypothetical protein AOBTE_LOCUS17942 [Acanthoscelides obtectus]